MSTRGLRLCFGLRLGLVASKSRRLGDGGYRDLMAVWRATVPTVQTRYSTDW